MYQMSSASSSVSTTPDGSVTNESAPSPPAPQQGWRQNKSDRLCRFFASGECRLPSCPFFHPLEMLAQTSFQKQLEDEWIRNAPNRRGLLPAVTDVKSNSDGHSNEVVAGGGTTLEICHDYAKGVCRFGDKCRYVHDPAGRAVMEAKQNADFDPSKPLFLGKIPVGVTLDQVRLAILREFGEIDYLEPGDTKPGHKTWFCFFHGGEEMMHRALACGKMTLDGKKLTIGMYTGNRTEPLRIIPKNLHSQPQPVAVQHLRMQQHRAAHGHFPPMMQPPPPHMQMRQHPPQQLQQQQQQQQQQRNPENVFLAGKLQEAHKIIAQLKKDNQMLVSMNQILWSENQSMKMQPHAPTAGGAMQLQAAGAAGFPQIPPLDHAPAFGGSLSLAIDTLSLASAQPSTPLTLANGSSATTPERPRPFSAHFPAPPLSQMTTPFAVAQS